MHCEQAGVTGTAPVTHTGAALAGAIVNIAIGATAIAAAARIVVTVLISYYPPQSVLAKLHGLDGGGVAQEPS
jgi:hypothetical protein